MLINDFAVGTTYRIRTKDWISPLGDYVPGKIKIRKAIAPLNRETADPCTLDAEINMRKEFLRVLDIRTNRIHLIHPDTIESAEPIGN